MIDPGQVRARLRSKPVAIAGFLVGLVLVLGAIATVMRNSDIAAARDAVREAPAWMLALAIVLPALNWLLISASFVVLNRRYARVGIGEMAALIGSAWLLNYLPLRPGMIGRLAYHKKVNGIHFRDSAKVLVQGIVCTAASGVLLVFSAVAFQGSEPLVWLGVGAATLSVLGLAAIAVLPRGPHLWRWPVAMAIRYLHLTVWAVRYAVVFALVGHPISPGAAVAIAAASQIVMLIPLTGNGLGATEWVVGLTAGTMHRSVLSATGLLAALVNRAAEMLVAVPVGLICYLWVVRAIPRHAASQPTPNTTQNKIESS